MKFKYFSQSIYSYNVSMDYGSTLEKVDCSLNVFSDLLINYDHLLTNYLFSRNINKYDVFDFIYKSNTVLRKIKDLEFLWKTILHFNCYFRENIPDILPNLSKLSENTLFFINMTYLDNSNYLLNIFTEIVNNTMQILNTLFTSISLTQNMFY